MYLKFCSVFIFPRSNSWKCHFFERKKVLAKDSSTHNAQSTLPDAHSSVQARIKTSP